MATKLVKGYEAAIDAKAKNAGMKKSLLKDIPIGSIIIIPSAAEGGESEKGYTWYNAILNGSGVCVGVEFIPDMVMRPTATGRLIPMECKLRKVSDTALELVM